ncbi:MAG: GlsB/YeaQ/YmgE family stress response membrane protein [Hyphomicrobiaceae bacterium]|nr:MAG: GlsB/YeaQ/YmgE family stress response membrane protein [Hyphomicrobiaceae bacterium]
MSLIAWLVVGILAGWLAERITGRDHGLLTNLIVGVAGAFVGGLMVSSLLGFRYVEGFNLPSIVVATLGAVILLAVFGVFQGRRTS